MPLTGRTRSLYYCSCRVDCKPTHQEVQYGHVYVVHQPRAVVVRRGPFHRGTIVWLCFPPGIKTTCDINFICHLPFFIL